MTIEPMVQAMCERQTTAAAKRALAARSDRGRGDRGVALIEFALVLPFLALLVFGVVDFGRAWQLQNRLSNAAHEAATSVESFPKSIAAACHAGNNATDRARQEDPSLATVAGYGVEVEKVGTPNVAITGCETSPVSLSPGDTLRVTLRANHDVFTPLVGALTGDPIIVRRTVDVVVQG